MSDSDHSKVDVLPEEVSELLRQDMSVLQVDRPDVGPTPQETVEIFARRAYGEYKRARYEDPIDIHRRLDQRTEKFQQSIARDDFDVDKDELIGLAAELLAGKWVAQYLHDHGGVMPTLNDFVGFLGGLITNLLKACVQTTQEALQFVGEVVVDVAQYAKDEVEKRTELDNLKD